MADNNQHIPGILSIPTHGEVPVHKWRDYGGFAVVILYPEGHPCHPYETDGWFADRALAEADILERQRAGPINPSNRNLQIRYVVGTFRAE